MSWDELDKLNETEEKSSVENVVKHEATLKKKKDTETIEEIEKPKKDIKVKNKIKQKTLEVKKEKKVELKFEKNVFNSTRGLSLIAQSYEITNYGNMKIHELYDALSLKFKELADSKKSKKGQVKVES